MRFLPLLVSIVGVLAITAAALLTRPEPPLPPLYVPFVPSVVEETLAEYVAESGVVTPLLLRCEQPVRNHIVYTMTSSHKLYQGARIVVRLVWNPQTNEVMVIEQ